MVRVNRFLVDTIVTCEGDRHDADPPWGIFGGHDGVNASTIRRTPAGRTRSAGRRRSRGRDCWPATRSRSPCRTRAATATRSSATRSSSSSDVLDGFTTPRAGASEIYGVVIDPETLELDLEATQRLRSRPEELAGQVFVSDAP